MIRNFRQLIEEAKKRTGIVVGVPSPEDSNTIQTVINARNEGLADFILCGNTAKIEELLKEHKSDIKDFRVVEASTEKESAEKIVELANKGEVHVILKGFLPTGTLLKPTLDKEKGLRTGNLFSDILFVENPAKDCESLLGMSDGGVNILPDLLQKKQIIENSVKAFHKLGYTNPAVGIMAAKEAVSDKMPATIDAAELTKMGRNGEITGCSVYGPLALDIAVSKEAAAHKGIEDPVAGSVDIMVVPNIEAGNLLGKAFTYYMGLQVGHVVMGARIPILIPSRNESETDKLNSVALGVIIA